MFQNKVIKEFFRITRNLNNEGVTPTIHGSVGVALLLNNKRLRPRDIDYLLPDDESFHQTFRRVILSLGYTEDPDHGQEFIGSLCNVSYETMSSVEKCLKATPLQDLAVTVEGVSFYNLTPEQHIQMYIDGIERNTWRGYRQVRKDRAKIHLLKTYLGQARDVGATTRKPS